MKLTNETKIGALALSAIIILIVGFYYLKGKNLFNRPKKLYAVFHKVDGLAVANPVIINGLQIGTVYEMVEKNEKLDSIIVTINMEKKDVKIPVNSLAYINKDLLGGASLAIEMGNANTYVDDGSTLNTKITTGLADEVKASINPALNKVNGTLESLDSLIEVVGSTFDPTAKSNFQRILANLTQSTASLQSLLNAQNGMLAQSFSNLNAVTRNLAGNNETINRTFTNLDSTTAKLARLNLDATLTNLNSAVSQLDSIVVKVNSPSGSVGLLLNDTKLYRNLENTTRSLNILMDDIRVHPRNYVNVSIFGKKNKGNYLTAPLVDTAK
ncbi:MAG: MCE family protein [Williamsia sp.]|nr:MCE family protein [Williamsia sp.]